SSCAIRNREAVRDPRLLNHSLLLYLKIPEALSFRSAALSREESAASVPAASRFLAGRPGFGMTMGRGVFVLHVGTPGTKQSQKLKPLARGEGRLVSGGPIQR